MAKRNEQVSGDVEPRRLDDLIKLASKASTSSSPEPELLEKIKNAYQDLPPEEVPVFFGRLIDTLDSRPADLVPELEKVMAAKDDPAAWRKALTSVRAAIESPRRRLFQRYIGLRGGLKFLLDLRADVLAAQREGAAHLGPLDNDLVALFESWFHLGFLVLEEVTQDSPYRQIELIKNNDMVHPMTSIEEMGQRLGVDRRCFALYHRAMPEEPVVFIEVALTRGIVRSIHDIIVSDADAAGDSGKRDTAIFYSINNTQNGLAGLGLGKVLIFQVVDFLKKEAPSIKTFCTLSPLPGFWRRYLKRILEGDAKGFKTDQKDLGKLFDKNAREQLEKEYASRGHTDRPGLAPMILEIFSDSKWSENKALVRALAKPIGKLGYIYLAEEKDRAGRPLDPVANFHLANGAVLSPGYVNFGANWSAMGIERSLSLMVNYVYSQNLLRQFQDSMSRLGGLVPGLKKPWSGRARFGDGD
ncbi:MAG: malonyl-CoA decarboxylase [Proteobacteria bacterium]|nr:malonyl-CoA decarboxylase [Pseudomonadota bacterium]